MSMMHDIYTEDLYKEIDRLRNIVFSYHNDNRYCDCEDCTITARKKGLVKFTHNTGEVTWVGKEAHAEKSRTEKCGLCNETFKVGDMMWFQDGDWGSSFLVCDDCYWDNQY